jgi:hypothetical protein
MATWKKVIVSGSVAELATVSASVGLIVGSNQQITTAQATTFLTGSFTGSFKGDGTNLTGVTATAIFPTTAKTDLASTDQFFINDGVNKYVTYGNLLTDLAGTNLVVEGTDSLALASQIVVTGVSASFTGSLTGALVGTASWATNATNATTATNATNVAVTDTTTGTGPYYVAFTDGTTGNRAVRVDSAALTFNATTNTLTVTSSYATQALTASYALNVPTTSSYANQALSASYALTASYVVLAQTASYVVTAQTASYVLNAVSASFASTASSIGNAVTNNTNNYLLSATGGGSINGESNLTFDGTLLTVNGNTTITGDLTVAGTASFTNTDNLSVKDKFILINSGSSTLADSGWITQYNAAGSGSAFFLEATSTGTYGRFAVAYDVTGTSTAPTPDEYVVTARVSASAAIPTNPTWGGSGNGSGNMFINSLNGDIYIYA